MGLLDAIQDPQFRQDFGRGLLDAVNRGVVGGLLGAPVDLATMAMRPFGYSVDKPTMGSEWIGQKLQDGGFVPDQRNPVAEALAGVALPAAAGQIKGVGLSGQYAKGFVASDFVANRLENASRSAKIKDPPQLPQRPFHDDYPQAGAQPGGSPLTTGIDGDILGARYIAGRRVSGGVDSQLDPSEAADIARLLGISTPKSTRSGPSLAGDAGRYVRGADAAGNAQRNIYLELEQLGGFKGVKGITHGPDAMVFKAGAVRDANKAAFDPSKASWDDICGAANPWFLGGLGGSVAGFLGAERLLGARSNQR